MMMNMVLVVNMHEAAASARLSTSCSDGVLCHCVIRGSYSSLCLLYSKHLRPKESHIKRRNDCLFPTGKKPTLKCLWSIVFPINAKPCPLVKEAFNILDLKFIMECLIHCSHRHNLAFHVNLGWFEFLVREEGENCRGIWRNWPIMIEMTTTTITDRMFFPANFPALRSCHVKWWTCVVVLVHNETIFKAWSVSSCFIKQELETKIFIMVLSIAYTLV